MQYYGTRLSENISRREPEGYLLCLNVPVARTGTQDYLPEELGLSPGSAVIPVLRPESEVFSPETVASFEGMPVTNDHPPDGVDSGNIRSLQKGHAHNVRRGSGEESDLLLADLIITDPVLIDAILEGKREISCGYTYELHEEDGQYIQRKIRGNHVAVVDAGRAGHRVSIRDREPDGFRSSVIHQSERRKTTMKKALIKKLTQMARDGDPDAFEALAEAVEEIVETPSGGPDAPAVAVIAAAAEPDPAPAEPAVVVETPEGNIVVTDEGPGIAEILEKLDRIISLLTPAAPAAEDDDPVEEIAAAVEEALEAAVEALEAAVEADDPDDPDLEEAAEELAEEIAEADDPMSGTIDDDDDCGGPEVLSSGDAIRATLSAIRPQLKKMSRKQRKKICADIASRMKKVTGDSGVYAAMAASGRRAEPEEDPAELGRRIMAKRNINYMSK